MRIGEAHVESSLAKTSIGGDNRSAEGIDEKVGKHTITF